MKSLVYICLILLALVAIASANSDKIVTGPYNIAFDLGTSLNYTVVTMPSLDDNNYTSYVNYIDVPGVVQSNIIIYDWKGHVDATQTTLVRITYYKQLWQICTHEFLSASVNIGKIDGIEALIAQAELNNSKKRLMGVYFPDSMKIDNSSASVGSIEVHITSTMPMNSTQGMDIAKSLLNTLHIEKKNALAAASTVPAVTAIRPSPYINTHNQNVEDQGGVANIDEAFSDGPGWLVVYNDKDSFSERPVHGSVVGYTQLNDGLNRDVKVRLNMALITPKLHAVIHKDAGKVGTFEYPGFDYPFSPRAEKIFTFYAIWPYPKVDFPPTDMMWGPGPEWL